MDTKFINEFGSKYKTAREKSKAVKIAREKKLLAIKQRSKSRLENKKEISDI